MTQRWSYRVRANMLLLHYEETIRRCLSKHVTTLSWKCVVDLWQKPLVVIWISGSEGMDVGLVPSYGYLYAVFMHSVLYCSGSFCLAGVVRASLCLEVVLVSPRVRVLPPLVRVRNFSSDEWWKHDIVIIIYIYIVNTHTHTHTHARTHARACVYVGVVYMVLMQLEVVWGLIRRRFLRFMPKVSYKAWCLNNWTHTQTYSYMHEQTCMYAHTYYISWS